MILSAKYSSSFIMIPRRRRLPEQAVVEDSEVQVEAVLRTVVVEVDTVDVMVMVSVTKKKGSRSPLATSPLVWLD